MHHIISNSNKHIILSPNIWILFADPIYVVIKGVRLYEMVCGEEEMLLVTRLLVTLWQKLVSLHGFITESESDEAIVSMEYVFFMNVELKTSVL